MSLLARLREKRAFGKLATATPAIFATQERKKWRTVANPRKFIPEAIPSQPRRRWLITLPDGELLDVTCTPPATREELLRGHPEALSAEPYQPSLDPPEAPLSASQEARIRAWLASIGEEDEAAIEEVLEDCRTDAEARDYFLGRASEASHEQS